MDPIVEKYFNQINFGKLFYAVLHSTESSNLLCRHTLSVGSLPPRRPPSVLELPVMLGKMIEAGELTPRGVYALSVVFELKVTLTEDEEREARDLSVYEGERGFPSEVQQARHLVQTLRMPRPIPAQWQRLNGRHHFGRGQWRMLTAFYGMRDGLDYFEDDLVGLAAATVDLKPEDGLVALNAARTKLRRHMLSVA